jgi:hypothetical protein
MIYTADWESLACALARVVSAHGDLVESKAAICNAIADKKIGVKVTVERSRHHHSGKTFTGGNVDLPARLHPDDFDWTQSRPLHPWRLGPRPGEHYAWIGGWEAEPISLIELLRGDVTTVLRCDDKELGAGSSAGQPKGANVKLINLRKKSAPKAKAIEGALRKHGFHLDQQGKSYKEIAKQIEPDVAGVFGPTEQSRMKAVERALKSLKK